MKKLRKNVDLASQDVAVLQIEASLNGYGTVKPFLEKILVEAAQKAVKSRPEVYRKLFNSGPARNGTHQVQRIRKKK